MSVEWDSEIGAHHLAEQPGDAPSLAIANSSVLPDHSVALERGDRVWLQRRMDGTAWFYDASGTLLAIDEASPDLQIDQQVCHEGHTFSAIGNPVCPVCSPPTTAAVDIREQHAERVDRRRFRLSYVVSVVVLALLIVVGDIWYRDMTMQQVLEAAEAVESSEVWADYFVTLDCGPDPVEVTPTSRMQARAAEIRDAAIALEARLDQRLEDLVALNVPLWHREVAIARDRLIRHETRWLWFLEDQAAAMDAVQQYRSIALAREGALQPWADYELAYGEVIAGTWLAARDAFERADANVRSDNSDRIQSIFQTIPDMVCGEGSV